MRLESANVDGGEHGSAQAHQRLQNACIHYSSCSSRGHVLLPIRLLHQPHHEQPCYRAAAHVNDSSALRPTAHTYDNAALAGKVADVGGQACCVCPAAARKRHDGEAHHLNMSVGGGWISNPAELVIHVAKPDDHATAER